MADFYSRPRWLARQVRQLVYPRRCPFCGRVLGFLPACDEASCVADVDALRRRPGIRLDKGHHYLGHLSGAAAPYFYEGRVRRAILEAKFSGQVCTAEELGVVLAREAFGSTIVLHGAEPTPQTVEGLRLGWDCVVPVPPSHSRRGYNVAELMAAPAARAVGVPLCPDWLRRVRSGRRQEGLSFEERLANVAGAFRAVAPPDAIEGRRILLVDDVITTGATAAACAQALLTAGASSVFAVALAAREWKAAPVRTEPIDENAGDDAEEL